MGAAASSEPPPDVVEACVTLESGDVEEILSVFLRAASCASPTNGFGGDASLQTTPRALAGRVVALDATVPGLDPDDPRTCEALGLSQALGRAAASLAMNDATDADVRPTALRARHLVTLAARCKSAEARAGLARDIFAIVGPERALRDLAILAVGESAVASDPLAGIALASLARALVDRDDLPRHIARRCPAAWDTLRALVQPSLRRIARPPVLADAAGVPLDLTRDSPRRLVTPFVAWFLSGGMPSEWRGAWRRLFDSDVDGLSFQTFLSRVVDQGPALVAVRTRAGDVLGGVSSESLTSKPEFFGDARSFVFALGRAEPDRSVDGDPPAEVGAHPASGRNENFAWCASGFASSDSRTASGSADRWDTTAFGSTLISKLGTRVRPRRRSERLGSYPGGLDGGRFGSTRSRRGDSRRRPSPNRVRVGEASGVVSSGRNTRRRGC